MDDVPLTPLRTTNGSNGAECNPAYHHADQRLRPVVMPVETRVQTRSTYEWVEFNSSPPPGLETTSYDGACDEEFGEDFDEDFDDDCDKNFPEDFHEAGLEPQESPVRPNTPVRLAESYQYREQTSVHVTASRQYRECTLSQQGRPKGSFFRVGTQSPRHALPLGSPFRYVPHLANKQLDDDAKSDWSSEYGSPKDAATIYLPLAINGNDDNLGGSSPYQQIPEHYPLSMANDRQAVVQSHTSAAGLDDDAVGDFELPNTPRFGSKLRYSLRSNPPHPDEDFPGYEEWEEWMESPTRGRARFRSPYKIAYSLV